MTAFSMADDELLLHALERLVVALPGRSETELAQRLSLVVSSRSPTEVTEATRWVAVSMKVDADALRRIDREAVRLGLTRSGYMRRRADPAYAWEPSE